MPNILQQLPRAGLIRRLAAAAYDLLLLTAMLFVIGMITVAFNQGKEFNISYSIPLFGLLFFGFFWTKGGQTLGMRAWRIALMTEQGERVNWKQSSIRYMAAGLSLVCGGMGFFWSWIDKDKRTWHDMLSKTYLVHTKEEHFKFDKKN